MSQRAKRPNRTEDGAAPTKRRKCRPTPEEEEAAASLAASWQPRPLNDLKISSIYNRSATEAPAELFRKDLISAMKLPDSEPLAVDEYWVICDQWKQEWERGVQVPVNPDSLPEPSVTGAHHAVANIKPHNEFKFPKNKYIRITKDEQFLPEEHFYSNAAVRADAACSYDLDECDAAWLKLLNGERALAGSSPISEEQLERVLEELEVHCWDRIQTIIKNEEGLGIEFDENVICDVCRSPDSEEGNEMVFCDMCNICVHQACYGITKIPPGQWLCRTCALSQRPDCLLCPNKGGAMKCTRSGQKWAHVSCALWIPEVSIGCVEKMEPITKISSIPQSRWALICVLCRERVGACIQCSVKTCKTAYHVTCAFKHGLEMRAIIEDENAEDGVKLRSYCQKHSVSSKKEKNVSGSEDDDVRRKKRKDMTSEEKNQARAARLHEIEAEFDKHVLAKDVGGSPGVDEDGIQYIYNYWKLKRRAGHNKPLLPPKFEDVDMLSHKQEQADLEKMKTFVQLRQDLERVRNLCYMVSRREKLSRTYFRMREQTFHKQIAVLSDESVTNLVEQAVIEANHGPSIYDRLYSHEKAEDHTIDFEGILSRIAGTEDEKINGLVKMDKRDNPYKRFFNGTPTKRRSIYGSSCSAATSGSESEHISKIKLSSGDDKVNKKVIAPPKRRNSVKTKKRRRGRPSLNQIIDSSSEEDEKPRNRGLRDMVREIGATGSDTDDLMIVKPSTKTPHSYKQIYSDSSEDHHSAASDSQQQPFRTKAAVKEFSLQSKPKVSAPVPPPDNPPLKKKEEETKGKKKPSDLIVPQRQAAKKASENMRSTTITRIANKEQPLEIEIKAIPIVEEKPKPKTPKVKESKGKEVPKSPDLFDLEKEVEKETEVIAYVPQRQAAKKAAEHIKSGLIKPGVVPEVEIQPVKPKEPEVKPPIKKEMEIIKTTKPEIKVDKKVKAKEVSSTSSSSSCSSSDTTTSSSSESESDSVSKSNVAKDWPFLDKVTKPVATITPSSDTSSSSSESDTEKLVTTNKVPTKSIELTNDKKLKTEHKPIEPKPEKVESKPKIELPPSPTIVEGEESSRKRTRSKRSSNTSDKIGDVSTRTRDITPSKLESKSSPERIKKDISKSDIRKRKSLDVKDRTNVEKTSIKSNQLCSPIRKTDKKVETTPTKTIPNKPSTKTPPTKVTPPKPTTKSTPTKSKSIPTKTTPEKVERKTSPEKVERKTTKSKPIKVEEKKEERSTRSKKAKNETENLPEEVKKPKKLEEIEPLSNKTNLNPDIYFGKDDNKMDIENEIKDEVTFIETKDPVEPEKKPDDIYTTRSIFSPQPTPRPELFDFDDSDAFGLGKSDEMPCTPFGFTDNLFKGDTKEDSARETLFLVEKLRMELSRKSTAQSEDMDLEPKLDDKTEDSVVPENKELCDMSVEIENSQTSLDNVQASHLPDLPYISESGSGYDSGVYSGETAVKDMLHEETPQMDSMENTNRWIPETNFQPQDMDLEPTLDQQPLLPEPPKEIEMPIVPMMPEPEPKLPELPPQQPEPMQQIPISTPSEIPTCQPSITECIPTIPTSLPECSKPSEEITPTLPDCALPTMSECAEMSRLQEQSELQSGLNQMAINQLSSCLNPPISSPYDMHDIHNHPKWSDRAMLPSERRLSSSSGQSESSNGSRRNEDFSKREEMIMALHPALDAVLPYNNLPVLPQFPNINDQLPFHPFSEATPFIGPVSLFPPQSINTQIPFPSPGPAMFPPSFGTTFPNALMPQSSQVSKPDDSLHFSRSAAFTSSSHNIAFTAAMVSQKPEEPPVMNNHRSPSPIPVIKASVGKKSPAKPTRSSARVVQQQGKSPVKSPGKSPRQMEVVKKVKEKVKKNNNVRNRGRGRGRGRGGYMHIEADYNTIHNKLIGTVYDLDFDEDIAGESMSDLRAMRERRKSTDLHERKEGNSYLGRDASISPRFASPTQNKRSYVNDLRDLRPPTPVLNDAQPFPDMVQPVLPGPVDMRTYSNVYDASSGSSETYSNQQLLGAFASGTADHPVSENLDEDYEKELHTALAASTVRVEPVVEKVEVKVIPESRNQLKVKIKGPFLDANYTSSIPTVQPVIEPIVVASNNFLPNNVANVASSSGTSNLRRMRKKELLRQYQTQDMNMDDSVPGIAMTIPTTPTLVNRTIITIPKAVASMTSIPTKEDYKAVVDANMEKKRRKEKMSTSHELRILDILPDDDLDMPERRRSVGSNGSSASGGLNADCSSSYKRRARPVRLTTQPPPAAPKLKIKIGTDGLTSTNMDPNDTKRCKRPPKKRLTMPVPNFETLKRESMNYRRMIMENFDEDKPKRERESKRERKSNKKKKKKKEPQVEIISDKGNTPKLIIRFGKKKEESGVNSEQSTFIVTGSNNPTCRTEQATDSRTAAPPSVTDCVVQLADISQDNSLMGGVGGVSALRKVRATKVTPIRLKIARCHEGTGYVMKTPGGKSVVEEDLISNDPLAPDPLALPCDLGDRVNSKEAAAEVLQEGSSSGKVSGVGVCSPVAVLEPTHDTSHTPLPLNKDCEVR